MEYIKRYLKYKNGVAQTCNLGKKDFTMDYEAMLNWYDY